MRPCASVALRAGERQVLIEDVVRRARVQAFDRSDDVVHEAVIVAERRLEILRELEVRIDRVDRRARRDRRTGLAGRRKASRRRRRDVRGVERRHGQRRRARRRTAAGQRRKAGETRVAERVRQVHERRRTRELADATAKLVRLVARDVPVEGDARREERRCPARSPCCDCTR